MYQTEKIILTQEIERIIHDIDAFKAQWKELAIHAPHRLLVLNHTAQLQNFIDKPDFFARVANQPPPVLTETQILQLHRELLKDDEDIRNSHGRYKTFHNSIRKFDDKGNEVEFVIRKAHPDETPEKMRALLEWYNHEQQQKTLHPLVAIAIFHILFLAIHPFDDGNGRICRFLTNLLLVQQGYIYMPFYGLENLIRKNNENWELALLQTEKTLQASSPNWQPWFDMFFATLHQQKNELHTIMQQAEKAGEELSPQAVHMLEHVRKNGACSFGELARAAHIGEPESRHLLDTLIQRKLLRKTRKGLRACYILVR